MRKNNNFGIFLLVLIIAAGAFLRFWGNVHGSFAFTYDVGRDLLAVRNMVDGHRISLLGPTMGIGGVFYGPWWYLFLAVPFVLSGGNPYFIASSIAFLGTIMIIPAYLLGRETGGRKLGLLFALFTAFSFPLVGFSTQIWNPDLLPPLMIISLAVFFFLIKRKLKRIFWWFILGLLVTLTFEMEGSFGFFLVLALSFSVLLQLIKNRKWPSVISYLGGIIIIELPRMAFEVRHDFLQTKSFVTFFRSGSSGGEGNFLGKMSESLIWFWQNWSETLGGQNLIVSVLSLGFTLIVFFLLGKKLKNAEKVLIGTLFLVILALILGFTFYPKSLWLHYFIGLPLIYLLFFLFAVSLVFEKFKNRQKLVIVFLLLFLFLISRPIGIYHSIREPFFKGDAAVFRNQIRVLDALYQDANGEKFNYVAYTPPLYTYTWDYLFGWYGKNKYGYGPDTETANFFYLIIEPEFEHPERLVDWFKLREKDGRFVKKETIAGGIILEKRLR